ncbi:MAG: sulfatase [Planctomycetota bacterium]
MSTHRFTLRAIAPALLRAALVAAGLGLGWPISAATPPAANIILILTDDQGWTSVSRPMDRDRPDARSDFYRTPSMDRLADRGMRFPHAYAAAPVCSPTRYSLLFAKTPARLGKTLVRGPNRVDHSQLSLPQMLKRVDPAYLCAHFGKWHIDVDPAEVGYDESDGKTSGRDGGFRYGAPDWKGRPAEDPKLIDHVTSRGIGFLRERAADGKPFYLQLSHYAVHSDILYRAETYAETQGRAPGSVHRHAGFAAMLEDLDAGVGRLARAYDELGLAGNTYLFFTSDNGGVPLIPPRAVYGKPLRTPGMNAPLRRGKWDLTEGGIRVPLFVVGPGVDPGSQCDTPVASYDFAPTCVELAGADEPMPDGVDGGSFAPLLRGASGVPIDRPLGDALVFHMPHYNNFGLSEPHSAIRRGRHKLLHFYDSDRSLLFDLAADIGERNDLSRQEPELTERLRGELLAYLATVGAEQPADSVTAKLRRADGTGAPFVEQFE